MKKYKLPTGPVPVCHRPEKRRNIPRHKRSPSEFAPKDVLRKKPFVQNEAKERIAGQSLMSFFPKQPKKETTKHYEQD